MTRLEAVQLAFLYATGKSNPTGTKLATLNALAVALYRQWQTEPDIEWNSLYKVVSAGTVSATDTFTLAQAINFISTDKQRAHNFVRVLTTGNSYIDFETVDPAELYVYRNVPAVALISPTQIQFSHAFAADDQAIGGSIQVPAIKKLTDITDDSSLILIDDPDYFPWRLAAQYVLPNKQLNYLYDDLMDQANDRLQGMIDRNGSGNESTSTGVDYFATMGNVGNR